MLFLKDQIYKLWKYKNIYSLKAVIKASFGKSISNLASVANGFWLTILLVTIVLEKR